MLVFSLFSIDLPSDTDVDRHLGFARLCGIPMESLGPSHTCRGWDRSGSLCNCKKLAFPAAVAQENRFATFIPMALPHLHLVAGKP